MVSTLESGVNTVRLRQKNKKCVGWVEERNPTEERGMLGNAKAQPNLQILKTYAVLGVV
jgi:hypothetical protein